MRFKLKASLKSWAEAHNSYIYIKNEYHEHIHINYLYIPAMKKYTH